MKTVTPATAAHIPVDEGAIDSPCDRRKVAMTPKLTTIA
ncbi:hypothetical protein MLGJGCBP_06318 [Rhodococcus sp. T7]|nr:hypothetical protein MLGJGCBP_09764 [Rhodococcus sp. T7]KAF0960589.1 hypothetical protein MLGJGCBP_06318 [Rhodococcus sp. T7]